MKQVAITVDFEAVSYDEVDCRLREDPTFGRMDSATRDMYRCATRKLAQISKCSEADVASCALRLAQQATKPLQHAHEGHIGHYLVGDGVEQIRDALGVQRHALRAPVVYVSGMLLAFLATAYLLIGTTITRLPPWAFIVAILPLTMAAIDFSMSLVNQLVNRAVAPKLLPRMDFSRGIPNANRVLVVVPCLLTSVEGIANLASDLERRFKNNHEANVFYCLLTDFVDAAEAQTPLDDELLDAAVQAIEVLRTRYGEDRFFLLNRSREWNAAENAWMGRERKRGKLVDLCRLLAHGDTSLFSTILGDASILYGIPYVLSLDGDNELPEGAVRKLVEAMAHPLSTAIVSEADRKVVSGYGVLQPRPLVAQSTRDVSLFQALGSEPNLGIPEDGPRPDVFQDIFLEGSYFGKGLLDVSVFDRLFSQRFPDNRILSHDLIEGCFARCGSVTDVSLPEIAPQSFLSHIARRHRWVRGDWQLSPWLFSRAPAESGWEPNTLTALSRWKIAHNLLRSVMPVAYFMLLAGASMLGTWWAGMALILMVLPAVLSNALQVLLPPDNFPQRMVIARTLGRRVALQTILGVAFIVHESMTSLDAIARALWRMLVTRKHLLEWQPFQHMSDKATLKSYFGAMWISPVFGAVAMATAIGLGNLIVAPIFALWIAAPWLAWRVGETHLDA